MISDYPTLSTGSLVASLGSCHLLGVIVLVFSDAYVVETLEGYEETIPFRFVEPYCVFEGYKIGDLVGLNSADNLYGVVILVFFDRCVVKSLYNNQKLRRFYEIKPYAPELSVGDIVKHHKLSPAFERLQWEGFGEVEWEIVEINPKWVRVIPTIKLPHSSTFDTRPNRRYTWQASCFEIIRRNF